MIRKPDKTTGAYVAGRCKAMKYEHGRDRDPAQYVQAGQVAVDRERFLRRCRAMGHALRIPFGFLAMRLFTGQIT